MPVKSASEEQPATMGPEVISVVTQERVKPVLILGIGNILLGDEGIGVRVIEALQHADWPSDVDVLDGGTGGADLVDLMADRQILVVVDAIDADAPPGTVVRLESDELLPDAGAALSLHQFALVDALAMAQVLGCAPHHVVVVGVQPRWVHPGLALSPEVQQAIPAAIDMVKCELARVRSACSNTTASRLPVA